MRFWSLGYPRVRGSGWWGHAYVRNPPLVGVEVCAKFGSGVKEGCKYTVK